jgi:parvulin-like peptidyl-prolyl isomerase
MRHNSNTLFLLFALCWNLAYAHLNPDKHNDNLVIASVGTQNIILKDFSDRYLNYLNATGMKDSPFMRKAILDNMIDEILLERYDDNSEVLHDKNYKLEIAWTEKQTVLAYLKDREIYAKISVTDDEIREAFERANEKISARHLYASTEEEANNLYELLKIGIDFDFLAAQVFTDSTLRNNGGYLGYFSWGDMDPAFEDAAFSLKIGEVSPPVKTAYGYSIIKLEDRIKHPLLTEFEFIQKKSHLERVLKIRKKKASEKDYIKNIFDPHKITFEEKELEKIQKYITEHRQDIETNKIKSLNLKCTEYNGKSYTSTDIVKRIFNLPLYHRVKINSINNLKAAIEGFIIQEKLLETAKSKGYDRLQTVKDTFKKLTSSVLLNYKKDEIGNKKYFSDSTIFNFYQKNKQLFTTENEINVQEIIVANKNLADSLKVLIDNGIDCGILAKKYSVRKWSAENSGVMGFAPISRFGILKDLLWTAKPTKLIGPIPIGNYFGLFNVIDKKSGQLNNFITVKNQALQALKLEEKQTTVRNYINELRNKIHVEIDENTLQGIKFND